MRNCPHCRRRLWPWRYKWFSLQRGKHVTIFWAWSFFYSRFIGVRSIGKTTKGGEIRQTKWEKAK